MSFAATIVTPVGMGDDRAAGRGVVGGPTLDEYIVGVWEALAGHGAGPCPVCEAGRLQPVYRAHARPVAGRCGACGSELR